MYLKYASLGYGQFTTEIHEMLQLLERIEGSRHAEHLHAWMSCLDLNIIQVPSEYPYDGPRLRICPLWTGKLVFHFLPAFHELRSRLQNTVEEGRWQLECDAREGFATLEECLYGWSGSGGKTPSYHRSRNTVRRYVEGAMPGVRVC
jgi:hypothetical protein